MGDRCDKCGGFGREVQDEADEAFNDLLERSRAVSVSIKTKVGEDGRSLGESRLLWEGELSRAPNVGDEVVMSGHTWMVWMVENYPGGNHVIVWLWRKRSHETED